MIRKIKKMIRKNKNNDKKIKINNISVNWSSMQGNNKRLKLIMTRTK